MQLIRRILVTVALILLSVEVWAQVSFTADAPALTALGSPFRVEFTVDAEPDSRAITAPDFEGFEVLAGPSISTGHSIQFINGKQSSSYSCTFTYVLLPEREGTFTIGAATIKVEGKEYSTKPFPVEIIAEKSNANSGGRGAASSPESRISKDDILIRLKLSDTEVYKGEAIRASLVLYTRASIDHIESLEMPPFDDFWMQELTFDNTPSREEYNGKVYETYKIRELLLSPQRSGVITIPATEMDVVAQIVQSNSRSFDPIFGGRQVYNISRKLRSAEQKITVKEFPKGAPTTFAGAVGSFTLSAKMPEAKIKANSSDQLSITISGDGNLKFITAPKCTLPDSFELYDTKSVDNIKVTTTGTSGSMTYTYPFVARSAGSFTLEPVVFTFFDPTTGDYTTLATEPFVIEVLDDGKSSGEVRHAGIFTDYGGAMRQLNRDIRFIHTDLRPEHSTAIFIFSPLYWLIVVCSLALFIVVFVLMRRRMRLNRNVVARRMRHADKVAVQRLRLAERYMKEQNRHAFYEEMLRAMWGYIGDKFNIPVSALTKETIREELYRRGVSSADAEQFCEIISRSDEAQYAPVSEGDMSSVYSDAVDVISKIESIIKR